MTTSESGAGKVMAVSILTGEYLLRIVSWRPVPVFFIAWLSLIVLGFHFGWPTRWSESALPVTCA